MRIENYEHKWLLINAKFLCWAEKGCPSWDKQKKYLKPLIKQELKLKTTIIDSIFEEFERILPDDQDELMFEWNKYQLPLLMVLASQYFRT